MSVLRRCEMDRPTRNTLVYLTRVKPHYLQNAGVLKDPFVETCLNELIGPEAVSDFDGYSRAFYSLEGHYWNLWKYDQPHIPMPDDPDLQLAIDHVSQLYRLDEPVTTIRWDQLDKVPFIPTSSAGWGYIGKKGAPGNHAEAIRRAVSSLYWWLEGPRSHRGPFRYHPDLAWTRTQLSTLDNPKIRHVWGKAFENIIIEGLTAAPLIEAYSARCEPMVIGLHLYRRLPMLIQQVLNPGPSDDFRIGIGLDIKSFDASIPVWLINVAFSILRQNLAFTGPMEEAAFEYTRHFFINTPVVMPDGRMWLKKTGIPSGSYFTSLIDSVANSILMAYLQLKVYGQVFPTYVLGDDSLFGIPQSLGWPDLDLFAAWLSTLNITLSTQKCVVTQRPEDLHFLGHCARHSRVDRDTAELIRLALYPEYPVQGPAMSVARLTGLLVDSALNSWPILHLYRYMHSKYRAEFESEDPPFTTTDKDWLTAIVGYGVKPSFISEARVFTFT